MLVDCEYFFCVDLLALKFGKYFINLENFFFQKIYGKNNSILGRLLKLAEVRENKFTATRVGSL